jgi:hypothetical protein
MTDDLAAELAALRPRPGNMISYHTLLSLRELRRRGGVPRRPAATPRCADRPADDRRAPGLLALYGAGHASAAMLLMATGDHPERLSSEAAWAHLYATTPIPASSGKVTRYLLNPGGERQASHARTKPAPGAIYAELPAEGPGHDRRVAVMNR